MLNSDRLQQIALYFDELIARLGHKSRDGEAQLENFKRYLSAVHGSEDYKNWLQKDQYSSWDHWRARPSIMRVPHEEYYVHKQILHRFALASMGRLEVKIGFHSFGEFVSRNRYYLTDGFWVPYQDRVYPTSDESEILCEYIFKKKYDRPDQTVSERPVMIDPACGCGHHALSLRASPALTDPEGRKRGFKYRFSYDINMRALAFARLNALLEKDEQHSIGINDVRDGLPIEVIRFVTGPVVFVVNMPFVLDPGAAGSAGSSRYGLQTGAELTLCAIEAILDFAAQKNDDGEIRAVILAYSLMRDEDGSGLANMEHPEQNLLIVRETIRRLKSVRAAGPLRAADITFSALPDQKLWRVNGKKSQPNPMPLENLQKKAECKLTIRDNEEERQKVKEGYERRAHEFMSEPDNWTHLAYGVLDLTLKKADVQPQDGFQIDHVGVEAFRTSGNTGKNS